MSKKDFIGLGCPKRRLTGVKPGSWIGLCICMLGLAAALHGSELAEKERITETGNVIFVHPDGTGMGHWQALRMVKAGPDGFLNWDRLEQVALYRAQQRNQLASTSHAGATAHAFGKQVHTDSFGMDHHMPLTALSGSPMSIMREAQEAGVRVGVVNSGHIAEPGTAVFLASSESRYDTDKVTSRLLASGADVIFSGGETLLLPKGEKGHFGVEGVRQDGRNLIEEAREAGYVVIFTLEELRALPASTPKVLGIFAADHTFNDRPEEALQAAGLPLYEPNAPTIAHMVDKALEILASGDRQFFLVVEEEGTDNFSNNLNATGMLEAAWRADEAIGIATTFVQNHPDTLLITAADTDAGHPGIIARKLGEKSGDDLPPNTDSGAALDGVGGTGTQPFRSLPDNAGHVHEFGIAWLTSSDINGSVIVRAEGMNANRLPTLVYNTDIYRMMYGTLFGKWFPWEDGPENPIDAD